MLHYCNLKKKIKDCPTFAMKADIYCTSFKVGKHYEDLENNPQVALLECN